jgi:hypothetical protein
MRMNVPSAVNMIKSWKGVLVLVLFLIGLGVTLSSWAKLPDKVTSNTVEIKDTKSQLDLFIMEQRTIQKEAGKREDLMYKILDKLSK